MVTKQQLSKSDSGYSGAVSAGEEEEAHHHSEEEEVPQQRAELTVRGAHRRYNRRVVPGARGPRLLSGASTDTEGSDSDGGPLGGMWLGSGSRSLREKVGL